jgi:DNA-binding PadR family transcriptional regulator
MKKRSMCQYRIQRLFYDVVGPMSRYGEGKPKLLWFHEIPAHLSAAISENRESSFGVRRVRGHEYVDSLTQVLSGSYYIRSGHNMRNSSPPRNLPLTAPVFHILLALSHEDRHGYGIMQDVAEQTEGALQLGPGTLYGCLRRMLAAGLIEESGEQPDPALGPGSGEERRRYYRITSLGSRTVRAEAQRIAGALAAAKSKRILAGGKA